MSSEPWFLEFNKKRVTHRQCVMCKNLGETKLKRTEDARPKKRRWNTKRPPTCLWSKRPRHSASLQETQWFWMCCFLRNQEGWRVRQGHQSKGESSTPSSCKWRPCRLSQVQIAQGKTLHNKGCLYQCYIYIKGCYILYQWMKLWFLINTHFQSSMNFLLHSAVPQCSQS